MAAAAAAFGAVVAENIITSMVDGENVGNWKEDFTNFRKGLFDGDGRPFKRNPDGNPKFDSQNPTMQNPFSQGAPDWTPSQSGNPWGNAATAAAGAAFGSLFGTSPNIDYSAGIGGNAGGTHGDGDTPMGGCNCPGEKPRYTCEEKCAYGRMMGEKCKGCRSSYRKKRPYRYSNYRRRTPYYNSGTGRYRGGSSGTYWDGENKTSTYKPLAYKGARDGGRPGNMRSRRQARQTNRRTRKNIRRS